LSIGISFALFVHVFSIRLADGIIQSRGVKVMGLTALVILAILLAGSILFGLTDPNISVADTGTSNNEVNKQYEQAYNEERLLDGDKGKKSGESESNAKGMLRLKEVA
jgi:hypothetical protein